MTREELIEGVLYGSDQRIGATLLRWLLAVFAFLHRIGLEIYLLPFHLGVRKRYRLPVPVIAIGNLSSGGTGKTPMTALVAGHLQRSGKTVVVLSRGHGGSGEAKSLPRVVSDGKNVLLTPEEAGDEPVLLASLLPGIPVVVCRDRRKSGRFAVEHFQPEVIVCDDALQYWQLHRDLDIVLLDARRPFDNGFVLPRGLLREPPSHLARAGVVVLTRADRVPPERLPDTVATVQKHTRAPVFTATHAPEGWVRSSDGARYDLSELAGKSVVAFSGIADGQAFVESVRCQGVQVVSNVDFADHHRYTAEDIDRVIQMVQESGATIAVTTEKDLVKVDSLWPKSGTDLYAFRIGMKVEGESAFLAPLTGLMREPVSPAPSR